MGGILGADCQLPAAKCQMPSCKCPFQPVCYFLFLTSCFLLLLVIEGFNLPLHLEQVVREEAKEAAAIFGCGIDVPLFAGPGGSGPPVAALAPGTEGALHGVAVESAGWFGEGEGMGLAVGLPDLNGSGWAEAAQGNAGAGGFGSRCGLVTFARGIRWNREAIEAEGFGLMRVGKHRATNAVFAYKRGDAGESDFQAHGFGELG